MWIGSPAVDVLRIYDMEGAPQTGDLRHSVAVSDATFLNDSRLVVAAAGRALQLWDSRTGQRIGIPILQGSRITQLQPLSGGDRLAVLLESGRLALWNLSPEPRVEALPSRR